MPPRVSLRGAFSYIYAVARFSRHFNSSPDRLGMEEVRAYQLHLVAKNHSWSHINQVACALRFFYGVTLGQKEAFERIIFGREPEKLPAVLNAEEVVRFLEAVEGLRNRIALTTAYAAGLRVREVTRLRIASIDSTRMLIHIEMGNVGRQRVHAPLSHARLAQGLPPHSPLRLPRQRLLRPKARSHSRCARRSQSRATRQTQRLPQALCAAHRQAPRHLPLLRRSHGQRGFTAAPFAPTSKATMGQLMTPSSPTMSSRPTSVDMRAIQRRASANSRIVDRRRQYRPINPAKIVSSIQASRLSRSEPSQEGRLRLRRPPRAPRSTHLTNDQRP